MVWVSLFLSLLIAADAGAQGTPALSVEAEVATAPVMLDGIVLFPVRGLSSYPAETRARVISQRIAAVAADRSIPVDALQAVPIENAVRIDAGTQPLMAVVDADGAVERVSRADLAAAHLIRLKQAIAEYRDARTPQARWRAALRTAAATAAFVVTIGLLVWLWRRIDRWMQRRVQARIHAVGIQSFEVVRAEQIRAALRSTLLGVRVVLGLTVTVAFTGYVLAQWPSTRAVSHGTIGLVIDPLRTLAGGLVADIPRFAFLAVLFVLVRIVLRIASLFFDAVDRGTVRFGNFEPEWAQPTYKLLRLAIVAFALVIAYPYIPGSDSEAFKGVSLFAGIVFSLGSSSAISNVIAGYMMTYRRAFKVGDLVKIGDSVGYVREMRLQVTHLRNYRNEEIIIPNSQILAAEVVNLASLGRTEGLMISCEVGIGYETSWRYVEAMLLEAAGRTAGLAGQPKPFVLVRKLGDFAVTYELNAPVADVGAWLATSTALNKHVLDVFNEHGVQIMTPAYEGDPAEPKVVPLKELYAIPSPSSR